MMSSHAILITKVSLPLPICVSPFNYLTIINTDDFFFHFCDFSGLVWQLWRKLAVLFQYHVDARPMPSQLKGFVSQDCI